MQTNADGAVLCPTCGGLIIEMDVMTGTMTCENDHTMSF